MRDMAWVGMHALTCPSEEHAQNMNESHRRCGVRTSLSWSTLEHACIGKPCSVCALKIAKRAWVRTHDLLRLISLGLSFDFFIHTCSDGVIMRDTESDSRRKPLLTGGNGHRAAETPSPHVKLSRKCTEEAAPPHESPRASATSGGASGAILRAHDC